MTLITTLQNISLSQVGPFFPIEAAKKGVSTRMVGFIISLNPILYIVASLSMVTRLKTMGRSCALRLGFFLIVSQLCILGTLHWVTSEALFVTVALFAQAMGGFGAGCNTTVCFSIITSHFPDEKQKLIGILEAGIGVGILVGPMLGALLNEFGGYSCPFWTLGAIYLMMFPLIGRMMRPLGRDGDAQRKVAHDNDY
mmetsp:Transcript_31379/g.41566  ORF Transcript_31379/g.41566 Transcript_31379/m.41566 type:complete len:197 (-) Transcript_31379:1140-1730(-)